MGGSRPLYSIVYTALFYFSLVPRCAVSHFSLSQEPLLHMHLTSNLTAGHLC